MAISRIVKQKVRVEGGLRIQKLGGRGSAREGTGRIQGGMVVLEGAWAKTRGHNHDY